MQRGYDSLGRLVDETARGQTVRREYDDVAGLADLVFPDGRRERTEYNPAGQPTRTVLVTPGILGGAPGDLLLELGYSTAGRLKRMRYGNGVEGEIVVDDRGRVIRIEYQRAGTLIDSCRLRYDDGGHRVVVQHLGAPASTVLHRFDGAERLVEVRSGVPLPPLTDVSSPALEAADVTAARTAAGAVPGLLFQLDDADARVQVTGVDGGGPTIAYATGPDHRVTAVGATPIAYDADGHRVADARYTYDSDALGRLRRVHDRATGLVRAELRYDALSRVAAGTTDGEPYERWFAGPTRVHERLGLASTVRQHSPHPMWRAPFCVVDGNGTAFVHQDVGWSTLCVSDAAGSVLERHRYDPFGVPAVAAADGLTPLAALRTEPVWRGMPAIGTTELFSTPWRIYDPETGVFISRDPLLYADSPNAYAYAAHNPVDFADPTGLAKTVLGGAAAGRRLDDSYARSHQVAQELPQSQIDSLKMDALLAYDLPPDKSGYLGEDYFSYAIVYGLKQTIYKPIKAHLFDERPKYLDLTGSVQTVPWRPDRMDAAVAYAQIASLLIPAPKFPRGSFMVAEPASTNPFAFIPELGARNAQLQEQVGQIASQLEPFRRITIGGATSEIGGQKITVVMVSDENAYRLLQAGELPEGVELMPRFEPWPKTLLPEQHMERALAAHLEAQGAQGGLVFTRGPRLLARGRMSGFACDTCAPAWFRGEYPTWWHSNADPANWLVSPRGAPTRYAWDLVE